MKEKFDAVIGLKVSSKLYRAAEQAACATDRSLAGYVRAALRESCFRDGTIESSRNYGNDE
jgi:hypothetical protein